MQARDVRNLSADFAGVTERLVARLAADHDSAIAARSSVDSQFRVVRTPGRVVYTRSLTSDGVSSRNVLTVNKRAKTAELRCVDRHGDQVIRTRLSLSSVPEGTRVALTTNIPTPLAASVIADLVGTISGLEG